MTHRIFEDHRKAKIDIDVQGGTDGLTALTIATGNSYYDIVNLLLDHKADLFSLNNEGKSAFTNINNNLLMIKLLKKEEKAFFVDKFTSI